MRFNYKNILVTGGCGFYGLAFVRYVSNVSNVRVIILES